MLLISAYLINENLRIFANYSFSPILGYIALFFSSVDAAVDMSDMILYLQICLNAAWCFVFSYSFLSFLKVMIFRVIQFSRFLIFKNFMRVNDIRKVRVWICPNYFGELPVRLIAHSGSRAWFPARYFLDSIELFCQLRLWNENIFGGNSRRAKKLSLQDTHNKKPSFVDSGEELAAKVGEHLGTLSESLELPKKFKTKGYL